MGFYKPNDSSNFRAKLITLKEISKGSYLKLFVLDKRDLKEKEVVVYKKDYVGGDIEISIDEIEHYEDFDELVALFLWRFEVKNQVEL